jgi:hypothetical protein
LDRFQALVRGCCASGRLITGKISDDANVENNLMTLASSYSRLLQICFIDKRACKYCRRRKIFTAVLLGSAMVLDTSQVFSSCLCATQPCCKCGSLEVAIESFALDVIVSAHVYLLMLKELSVDKTHVCIYLKAIIH